MLQPHAVVKADVNPMKLMLEVVYAVKESMDRIVLVVMLEHAMVMATVRIMAIAIVIRDSLEPIVSVSLML